MTPKSNVVAFPGSATPKEKPQVIISEFDGESCEMKIQYEHLVNAISMYITSLPFALPPNVDVCDLDIGVEVDRDGYVALDVYFG